MPYKYGIVDWGINKQYNLFVKNTFIWIFFIQYRSDKYKKSSMKTNIKNIVTAKTNIILKFNAEVNNCYFKNSYQLQYFMHPVYENKFKKIILTKITYVEWHTTPLTIKTCKPVLILL